MTSNEQMNELIHSTIDLCFTQIKSELFNDYQQRLDRIQQKLDELKEKFPVEVAK